MYYNLLYSKNIYFLLTKSMEKFKSYNNYNYKMELNQNSKKFKKHEYEKNYNQAKKHINTHKRKSNKKHYN